MPCALRGGYRRIYHRWPAGALHALQAGVVRHSPDSYGRTPTFGRTPNTASRGGVDTRRLFREDVSADTYSRSECLLANAQLGEFARRNEKFGLGEVYGSICGARRYLNLDIGLAHNGS